jgi:hypothetical protein
MDVGDSPKETATASEKPPDVRRDSSKEFGAIGEGGLG